MPRPTIEIACLCAAWCRLCDDYRSVLREVAAELDRAAAASGIRLRWHWIDIEDEAELLGEVEVETFPTLVVADAAAVRYAGPVMPQPETVRRLLRATVLEPRPGTRWPATDEATRQFASRLGSRAADRL